MAADDRGAGRARGDASWRPPVNLKALARHLGLSSTTVSLVVNGSPAARSIPQRTKDRILAAARELNYRPSYLARSLRSRRSLTIGVLIPEVSEGYAAGILSGIDSFLGQEGYFFLVASHHNEPGLLEEHVKLFQDRLVEGFVLVNTPITRPMPLPAVVVSGRRRLEGVTNVVIDHDRGVSLALSHLKEHGHERVAFFRGHKQSADTEDRWRAVAVAARSLGMQVRPDLVLELEGASVGGPFPPEEGCREGAVFGERLLGRGVPFTALFAFNDVSAIGAMRAFRAAGRRVPEDISVIGFDDIQSAAFQNPSLTTVRQPLREIGEIAARALLQRIRGGPSPHAITVEPQLVVRESTGPAPVLHVPPPAHRSRRSSRVSP
jgi:DNA-binding LacI/PurR family transcriptional regulator